MTLTPDTSIQYLKSVGPKRAESFSRLGINTIAELLLHFPSKYLDRSTIQKTDKVLKHIRNGYEGEITMIGKVITKSSSRFGRKQLLKVTMEDECGTI